jgi:hypothetical protein
MNTNTINVIMQLRCYITADGAAGDAIESPRIIWSEDMQRRKRSGCRRATLALTNRKHFKDVAVVSP